MVATGAVDHLDSILRQSLIHMAQTMYNVKMAKDFESMNYLSTLTAMKLEVWNEGEKFYWEEEVEFYAIKGIQQIDGVAFIGLVEIDLLM